MSDYGADPDPDLNRMRTVAFGFNLANLKKLKVDQFSTGDTDKVYSFVQKIGSSRLLVRVNPSEVSG